MRIYLAGPPGPDQVATKWLMEQRGYDNVVCESDILRKNYIYNNGVAPSKAAFLQFRCIELAQAGLCVVPEDLSAKDRAQIVAAAAFAGTSVLAYADLPAHAPSIMREDQLFAELMAERNAPVQRKWWVRLSAWGARLSDAFDARWGWFFTNGNKVASRPMPRPYHEPRAAHNITN